MDIHSTITALGKPNWDIEAQVNGIWNRLIHLAYDRAPSCPKGYIVASEAREAGAKGLRSDLLVYKLKPEDDHHATMIPQLAYEGKSGKSTADLKDLSKSKKQMQDWFANIFPSTESIQPCFGITAAGSQFAVWYFSTAHTTMVPVVVSMTSSRMTVGYSNAGSAQLYDLSTGEGFVKAQFVLNLMAQEGPPSTVTLTSGH